MEASWGAGQRRVLLVEDDLDIRDELTQLLEDEGFQVTGAGNGLEAMNLLRQARLRKHPPNVILLDLMMPVMNGWQFLREQRQDPNLSAIPVVVMSATSGLRRGAGEELAAAALLSKPVAFDTLVGALDRFCGEPSLVTLACA